MKITLVELPATQNGNLFEKPAQDVYSLFYLPSRAIDLLRAILEEHGYTDIETVNPRFNKRREVLSEEQLERLYASDVVGISSITRTIPQSYELADLIRENNPDAAIVFGGPHVTALPEEALEHCDYVVRNEGDLTFPELVARIAGDAGAPELENINGISYRDEEGNLVHTPNREFTSNEQLDALPLPVYDRDTLEKTRYVTINTSRGCPYKCEFCSVVSQFGSKYRVMSIDKTVDYIKHVIEEKKGTGKYSVFFGDDHFAANTSRTRELVKRIIAEIPDMPRWSAQVRVETAHDAELLRLMKQAGCFKVYIGFESIDEDTLKAWNKRQDLEKIKQAIRLYHKAGISIHGMFVFGSDFDTEETVKKTVDFANSMNIDTVQFVSLLPLPGTPLCKKYEEQNKILTKEWHKYSGHQVIVNPKNLSPYKLQKSMLSALRRYYNLPKALKQLFRRDKGISKGNNFVLRILGMALRYMSRQEVKEHAKGLKVVDRFIADINAEFDLYFSVPKMAVAKVQDRAKAKREEILRDFASFKRRMGDKLAYYTDKYRGTAPVKMLEQVSKGMLEELRKRALGAGLRGSRSLSGPFRASRTGVSSGNNA